MIRSEIHKLYLNGGSLFTACSFFSLAFFCFSLALGPEKTILQQCTPALSWILAILTFLFSTPFFLKAEYEAGLLDEVVLHPLSPSFYMLTKIGAEVLVLGLPLLALGTLFSCFSSLSLHEVISLSLSLLIGFPALSALGILGGLLTVQAYGGGILIALLILPFTIPLVLFSLSIMERGRLGLDSFAPFCLLMGVSLLLVIISVGAGQWAFYLAVED